MGNSRTRSIIYRTQKNLDKQDENSHGEVSSPSECFRLIKLQSSV